MEKFFNFLIFTFFAFVVINCANHIGELIGYPNMTYIGISTVFGAVMVHIGELENKNKDKDD